MKQIGIDVGGTFTDVVLLDEVTGSVTCFKAATDYQWPADGVMRAFDAADVDGPDVSYVKLGTTLGLNALLTRRGAETGLITTAGFRDVLEIRRTHRDRLFDLDEQIPQPLVPRHRRMEVRERVGADGSVVTPLDEKSVRRAWAALRDQGVTSVAIAFLFSFKNPRHERRARDIIAAAGGADVIFISSEVLPVHREYERTSTTATAAYVAPVVRNYVTELDSRLGKRGMSEGSLSVMTNSGGSMTARFAASAPIPTLLSGPAGGVTAAQWLARQVDSSDVLTLDMGGTSCDVSGIQAGIPDERLDMSIAGFDIAYPTFDIHTIGAGGGSIAWIDGGGAIRVGPASAGSSPGPACYGRGGELPTVTDANLLLGRYDPAVALGGSLMLDVQAARRAIDEHIATPAGLRAEQAAAAILRLVNANMMNAVRSISVERGRDPRGYVLIPFGGGGPVHASEIARELAISTVIVPPFPGCMSAFGAALSVSRRDSLRSINADIRALEPDKIAEIAAALIGEIHHGLGEEGIKPRESKIELWFNLHYRGQAHELTVRHPGLSVTRESLERARASFTQAHARQYGHAFDDVPVELVTVRATGTGPRADPSVSWRWAASAHGKSRRRVYFEEINDYLDTDVFDRSALPSGARIEGPAVIHQPDATVLVPQDWVAENHPAGSLLMTARRTEAS